MTDTSNTTKKTYPNHIVIRGTQYDRLICWVGGDDLILRIGRWHNAEWGWVPRDITYVKWLDDLSDQDIMDGRKIYVRRDRLQELVLSAESYGIPLYNGFKRRGKLTDEEWAIISSLPDSRARATSKSKTKTEAAHD